MQTKPERNLPSAAMKIVTYENRNLLEYSPLVTGIGARNLWYQQRLSSAPFHLTNLLDALLLIVRTSCFETDKFNCFQNKTRPLLLNSLLTYLLTYSMVQSPS